jgi:hypothetical protein
LPSSYQKILEDKAKAGACYWVHEKARDCTSHALLGSTAPHPKLTMRRSPSHRNGILSQSSSALRALCDVTLAGTCPCS